MVAKERKGRYEPEGETLPLETAVAGYAMNTFTSQVLSGFHHLNWFLCTNH